MSDISRGSLSESPAKQSTSNIEYVKAHLAGFAEKDAVSLDVYYRVSPRFIAGVREMAALIGQTVAFPESVQFLGGCNCAFKSPTVPTCRDRAEHLADCPAKDSGYPVGTFLGGL